MCSGCDEHPSEKDKGTGNNILSSHNKPQTVPSWCVCVRTYGSMSRDLYFYKEVRLFLEKKTLLLVIQNDLLTRTACKEESCINHTSFLRGSAAVALRVLCTRLSTAFEASLNKLILIRRQGSVETFSNVNIVQLLSELMAGKTYCM